MNERDVNERDANERDANERDAPRQASQSNRRGWIGHGDRAALRHRRHPAVLMPLENRIHAVGQGDPREPPEAISNRDAAAEWSSRAVENSHREVPDNRNAAEAGANNRVLVGSVTRIAARDSSSEASDRRTAGNSARTGVSSSSPVAEDRKALANRSSAEVGANNRVLVGSVTRIAVRDSSNEASDHRTAGNSARTGVSSSSPVAEDRKALANRSSEEVGANNRVSVGSVTRIAARDSSSEASDRRIGRKVATNRAVLSVRGLLTGRRVEVADATSSEAAPILGAATANLDHVGVETANNLSSIAT